MTIAFPFAADQTLTAPPDQVLLNGVTDEQPLDAETFNWLLKAATWTVSGETNAYYTAIRYNNGTTNPIVGTLTGTVGSSMQTVMLYAATNSTDKGRVAVVAEQQFDLYTTLLTKVVEVPLTGSTAGAWKYSAGAKSWTERIPALGGAWDVIIDRTVAAYGDDGSGNSAFFVDDSAGGGGAAFPNSPLTAKCYLRNPAQVTGAATPTITAFAVDVYQDASVTVSCQVFKRSRTGAGTYTETSISTTPTVSGGAGWKTLTPTVTSTALAATDVLFAKLTFTNGSAVSTQACGIGEAAVTYTKTAIE